MKELLTQLCKHLEQSIPVALATVIYQEGSTPRGAGSKMLVGEQGLIAGTIGGGLAEAQAINACIKALQTFDAEIMTFTLSGEIAAQSEMICGGLLNIFIEPLTPDANNINFFRKILINLDTCKAVVLTELKDAKIVGRNLCLDDVWDVQNESSLTAEQKNTLLAKLLPKQEMAYIQGDDGQSYIIECYPPSWQMIIAGGGHVSLFTAQVAALAGFSVVVLDDRPEFSAAARFPQASATHTVPDFANCFAPCSPTKHTCIVIVTRGHLHDKTVLAQALLTKASYIGMIGSKRKRTQVYNSLLAQGVTQAEIDRVYCPIGLGIKAETPEEIAVSIVAECIAHRREAWDVLQR